MLTQLRKNLSTFSEEKYKRVWEQAPRDKQDYIRTSLFECLHKEKHPSVRNILADSIGQIAGSVMSINVDHWPKFVECVYALFRDPAD